MYHHANMFKHDAHARSIVDWWRCCSLTRGSFQISRYLWSLNERKPWLLEVHSNWSPEGCSMEVESCHIFSLWVGCRSLTPLVCTGLRTSSNSWKITKLIKCECVREYVACLFEPVDLEIWALAFWRYGRRYWLCDLLTSKMYKVDLDFSVVCLSEVRHLCNKCSVCINLQLVSFKSCMYVQQVFKTRCFAQLAFCFNTASILHVYFTF